MRPLLPLITLLSAMLLVSCTPSQYYEVPNDRSGYAVIDDDKRLPSLEAQEFVRIQSVDRVKLSPVREGIPEYLLEEVAETPSIDVKNAIIVTPGEHKLKISACEQSWAPVLFSGPYKCAVTVIRLQADDGGRYRVGGSVSKEQDHADIWVKDLATGDYVVAPLRIRGLERRYYGDAM